MMTPIMTAVFRRFLLVEMLWLALPMVGQGQQAALETTAETSERPRIETREIEATPKLPPVPALAYRFWPSEHVQQEGSADRFIMRAVLMVSNGQTVQKAWREYAKAREDKSTDWSNGRLEGERLEAAKKWLGQFPLASVLGELRRAALKRDNVLRLELGDMPLEKMFALLLPEIQETRNVARLLRVEISVLIAEQKYEEAIDRLQLGFRLASSFRSSTFLISQLVGIAIATIMQDAAMELVSSPDAPNIYWALATLPRPLIPIDSSARAEMEQIKRFMMVEIPVNVRLTPGQWNEKAIDMVMRLQTLDGDADLSRLKVTIGVAAYLTVTALPAKNGLVKAGFNEKKVKQMSPAEAVLRWIDYEGSRIVDDRQKWMMLPRSIRGQYLDRGKQQAQGAGNRNFMSLGPQTIIDLLLPAVAATQNAERRLQVILDLLQTTEAIRAYVAVNDAFPKSLEKLEPLPALLNPRTGEPFGYALKKDDKGKEYAVLTANDHHLIRQNRIVRIQLRDE